MGSQSQEQTQQAARAASSMAELVEVLWARSGERGPCAVSPSQLKVLFILEDADGVNLRTVTERLGSTPPSVSRLCDRLETAGLVKRTANPVSRRELRLRLTERGHSVLRDLRRRRERELHTVIARMPPTKRAMLLESLTAFQDAAAPAGAPGLRTPRSA